MNANNAKVQSVIETALASAIGKLTGDEVRGFVSDIYIQADLESGELQVYDEEEKLVEKIVIFDWVNNSEGEDVFNKRVAASVKAVLTLLSTKGVFEHARFIKPLSVSLTDEDFVEIEELLFLDDETFRLDDPLLKDLDAELDDFLDKLLSDIK